MGEAPINCHLKNYFILYNVKAFGTIGTSFNFFQNFYFVYFFTAAFHRPQSDHLKGIIIIKYLTKQQ